MSFRYSKRRISATLQLDGTSKVQTNRKISSPSLEPLEGMVVCPIDLNLLEDPRLLPCGHAFCCECLTNYMRQLQSSPAIQKDQHAGEEAFFACPICRMACAMPPTRTASSFPKAFNHLVILDFLRKNNLSALKTNQTAAISAEANGTKSRKTSMQVNSQMLNYIVSDIAARERDGKIGPIDRAVILDEVTALLEKLGTKDVVTSSPNNKQSKNHTVGTGKRSVCSSSSTNSPTGSFKQIDRFNAFASKVRKTRRVSRTIEVHPDTPSYESFRDAESMRLCMKDNATYGVLNKGKDCCIIRPGEQHQPVDMRLIMLPNSHHLWRQTLTTNEDHTKLIMWCQPIAIDSSMFSLSERKQNTPGKTLLEISGSINVPDYGTLKIQYLRFFGDCVYLSGTVVCDSAYPGVAEIQLTELNEIGLIVCCSTPSIEKLTDKQAEQPSNPFPVQSVSCTFRRDSIGSQRLHQPIVFGFDIDQATGDVYIAQPANAMISRVHTTNMTQVNGTWYLNEPQLSPHFVCYAEASRQIWATCPDEEKIAILDLENDGFHHFNPHESFGITPSHIIYSTDERIVMLDQKQSRLFWITKVHQTICVQCLDIRFTSRLKRQFSVIQPMEDTETRALLRTAKLKNTSVGGIMCAHDYGCSVLYPNRSSGRTRLRAMDCSSSLCGP